MKKPISTFSAGIIAIATVILLVFNPIPRLIYGVLGWNTLTQILFFIAIMILFVFVTVRFEQRKRTEQVVTMSANIVRKNRAQKHMEDKR